MNTSDRANLQERLLRLRERQDRAHELGIPALHRLMPIAQRDTGQSRRVAAFLLSCYNSTRFPFPMDELRGLDEEIFDDCIRVLQMDSMLRQEVHTYFPGGSKLFEKLAQDWRMSDHRRLKLIAQQLTETGVSGFENGEKGLQQQLRHALDGTWPAEEGS